MFALLFLYTENRSLPDVKLLLLLLPFCLFVGCKNTVMNPLIPDGAYTSTFVRRQAATRKSSTVTRHFSVIPGIGKVHFLNTLLFATELFHQCLNDPL